MIKGGYVLSEISIIVPVYNAEKDLSRCIKSIQNQSYKDIEIILVNDGSTDKSGIICDDFAKKDSRIKVVHLENSGVSNARNVGIELSQSEYIQFVDSDDLIANNMCEILIEYIKKYNADVVMCGFEYTCNEKIVKSVKYQSVILNKRDLKNNFGKLFLSGYLPIPWNKLYRKNKIKSYFNKEISLGEDLEFNIQFLKNTSRIICITEVLYTYSYMNVNSLSNKKNNNQLYYLSNRGFNKVDDFAFNYLKCDDSTYKYINSIIYRDLYYILKSYCNGQNSRRDCEILFNDCKKYIINRQNNKAIGLKANIFRLIIIYFNKLLLTFFTRG